MLLQNLKPQIASSIKRGIDVFGGNVCIILLIVASLLIALPCYRSEIDFSDEGSLAYGAELVLGGHLPHRDFVSLQPPLSFYTTGVVFKIFGISLASLRVFGLGIYILITLLVYSVSRIWAGRVLSLAVATPAIVMGMPYFNFVPYAVWQGMAAALISVLFYLRAMQGGWLQGLALPAGLATGTSVLLRQDQGFYLLVSLLIYTLALNLARKESVSKMVLKRVFSLWIAGIVLVIIPWGVYWWLHGALPEMFQQLILFPITTYTKTSSLPFPSFSPALTLSQNSIAGLYYFLPVTIIALATCLLGRIVRSGFHLDEAGLVFILTWVGLFYCQVLVRSDLYHLLITLPPFLVLMARGWQMFIKEVQVRCDRQGWSWIKPIKPEWLVSFAVWSVMIWFLWLNRNVFLPATFDAKQTVALERAGVRVREAKQLKHFVQFVQRIAPADRSILCLPYEPMLYFLCERRNPTRWNYLWPGDQTPEEHQYLIRQAKTDPPAVIIITDESKMCRYAQDILDYVHSEYQPVLKVGSSTIYTPR